MNMKVNVGGSLPASLLPELRIILQDDSVKLVDGEEPELDTDKQLLSFSLPNSIQFDFTKEEDMDGALYTDLELDDFCMEHNLTISKLIPPWVDHSGEHYSEFIKFWEPGMASFVSIHTNGNGLPVVGASDVINMVNRLWHAHCTIPVEESPLHLNAINDIAKSYAIGSLAGKNLAEIFKELVTKRVGHIDPRCPQFTIVKGK